MHPTAKHLMYKANIDRSEGRNRHQHPTLTDRLFRQIINQEAKELNNIIDQIYLTDIYIAFHPVAKECIFSSTRGTLPRIDH